MKRTVALILALFMLAALLCGCGSAKRMECTKRAHDLIELSAFSKTGLIAQLESEGFSRRDAEAVVKAMDIDWGLQAAYYMWEHPFDFILAYEESIAVSKLQLVGFTREEASRGYQILLSAGENSQG